MQNYNVGSYGLHKCYGEVLSLNDFVTLRSATFSKVQVWDLLSRILRALGFPGKRVPSLKNPMQKLVNALLTGARCAIVGKWKCTHPPSETDFLERVCFIRRMEYLTALRNDTVDSFDRIWSTWDSTQIV
ncbi:hypothetical protein XELAEV_18031992mg [Xenopus laevis]|uniref:Uncharacterized protein n=1 Tax=Xenopus laevis TaxID=8355 RepID=A0A974HG83_XENLA|nr:hypothetical protein XELAEV_18031992mg [Xenopus laevis]